MTTYTVTDCAQDRRQVFTADTDAEALKAVYETLCAWNPDERDCAAAIAAGYVANAPSGARNNGVTYLDLDPAGFWSRCAELMATDNQDFFAGETASWEDDGNLVARG